MQRNAVRVSVGVRIAPRLRGVSRSQGRGDGCPNRTRTDLSIAAESADRSDTDDSADKKRPGRRESPGPNNGCYPDYRFCRVLTRDGSADRPEHATTRAIKGSLKADDSEESGRP